MEDDEPMSSDGETYRVRYQSLFSIGNGKSLKLYSTTDSVVDRLIALRLCEDKRVSGYENENDVVLICDNGEKRNYTGEDLTRLIRESRVGLRGRGEIV